MEGTHRTLGFINEGTWRGKSEHKENMLQVKRGAEATKFLTNLRLHQRPPSLIITDVHKLEMFAFHPPTGLSDSIYGCKAVRNYTILKYHLLGVFLMPLDLLHKTGLNEPIPDDTDVVAFLAS